MKVESLDNIDNKVLDKLVKLYGNKKQFFISDERKTDTISGPREYFLITRSHDRKNPVEWTFIWINNNLWQFRYCNVDCSDKALWENPLNLLNKILTKK